MSIATLKDDFEKTLSSVMRLAKVDSIQVDNTNKKLQEMVQLTKKLGEPAEVNPTDLYLIALSFISSKYISSYEYSCLGAAINMPIREFGNKRILDTDKLQELLLIYRHQLQSDDFLIGTWWRLFQAYFNAKVEDVKRIPKENRKLLCVFFSETYRQLSQSGSYKPAWLDALHEHRNLLTLDPCSRYAVAFVAGDRSEVDDMSSKVNIPKQSWFWHHLILSVVMKSCESKDNNFKANIPMLLNYVNDYSGYKDIAIREILKRYQRCSTTERHDELCRYVIKRDVWGSPEFKRSNASSKWHKVDEVVFKMVLSWVNKEKLRLFFEKLTERYETDKSRFKFWSKYERQICDEGLVILVIGRDTIRRAKSDLELKKVIGEKGTFACLESAPAELDAIIMQIRDTVIVEFTMTGHAGYIYSANKLPFSLGSLRYDGDTTKRGLKAGLYQRPPSPRIMHSQGWEEGTRSTLMNEGIFPD